MGNNYFNPRTYLPQQAPTPPKVTFQAPQTYSNLGYLSGNLRDGVAGTNQPTRAMLGGMLWGNDQNGVHTPGIFERMRTQMGDARDQTKAATKGFGSIKWVPDDPTTTDVDESLIPQYDANTLGKNERAAAQGGQQQANARGMMYSSFGDQMVGAALQRVGEQARSVINQYSGQINQIANSAQQQATSIVSQLSSLYGQDVTADATATYETSMLAGQAAANAPAPAPDPATFTKPAGHYSKAYPNTKVLNDRFGEGNYKIVQSPGGKGWDVLVA